MSAKSKKPVSHHVRPEVSSPADGRWLLVAYAISGAAALAYEVGWMRELSTMLGATAYASGIMLAAYMTGLGLGTTLGVRLAKRSVHPLRDASRAELAVVAFSVIAFLGIHYAPGFVFDLMKQARLTGFAFLVLQFAISFVVMLLPTLAMGVTYPLMMQAVGRREDLGRWAGRLYAFNTAGAIAGSLLAGFVLLPTVGVKGCLFAAAVFSSIAAITLGLLATRTSRAPSFWRSVDALVAPVALLAVLLMPATSGTPLGLGEAVYFQSSAQYRAAEAGRKTLYSNEGIYSRVAVVEAGNGARDLTNGALIEGGNSEVDRTTTTLIALVPAESAAATRTALVVGLGTGYTSQTYERLGFDHVTTVEINPGVVPASTYFVGPAPTGDSRWNIVVDDARVHILTNPETYDAITSEPSWPWSSGVAALFTREFVAAAKTRLNPGGVYCQWLPNYLLKPDDVKMMYKTMRAVYPRVDVWSVNFQGNPDSELLLIGHGDASGRSQQEVKALVDAALPPFTSQNPIVTTSAITPYADTAGLEKALSDPSVPLNTDDRSTLEYRVFWNFLNAAVANQTGG